MSGRREASLSFPLLHLVPHHSVRSLVSSLHLKMDGKASAQLKVRKTWGDMTILKMWFYKC